MPLVRPGRARLHPVSPPSRRLAHRGRLARPARRVAPPLDRWEDHRHRLRDDLGLRADPEALPGDVYPRGLVCRIGWGGHVLEPCARA